MIAAVEPAKKREAGDILGTTANKKLIEKEEEVKAPLLSKSKKAAPPGDSSAAASSSGQTPKPKVKAKGRPKKEPVDTSAAAVSKGENYDKARAKALTIKSLFASLRKAMNDGDMSIADTVMLENKIE